jgi:hypothetical protein
VLRPRAVVLCAGRAHLLCARTVVLCRPLVLRSQVLPSPLPPVWPSLLQEELLCSRLLRAHLLCAGAHLLCPRTLVLCSAVLRSQVLPSPLPPVWPSLLQEELLRVELLCSRLRAELLCPG